MSDLWFSPVSKNGLYWCITIREGERTLAFRKRIARARESSRYSTLPTAPTRREANRVRDEFIRRYKTVRRASNPRQMSIADFIKGDLERYEAEAKASSFKDRRTALRRFEADMGPSRLIRSITTRECMEWRATLLREYKSHNIPQKYVMYAKNLMKQAVIAGAIDTNPFEGVRSGRVKVKRKLYYHPPETLNKLLATAERPEDRCLFALCYLAGLRTYEAEKLEWQDIDWERGTITVLPEDGVESTKSRAHTTICPARLKRVLMDAMELPRPCAGWSKRPYKRWRQIFREAGVFWNPGHGLKDFRHSFKTNLRTQGVSPEIITRLMGHSSIVSFDHYLMVLPSEIDRANKLSENLHAQQDAQVADATDESNGVDASWEQSDT